MKILITGGAGYLAGSLIPRLANNPLVEEITLYDNLKGGNTQLFFGQLLNKKVKLVEGDLLDSRKLKKAVAAADVVYHFAAKVTTPFADEDPHSFEQTNNWGTAELCYAVEASPVKKLVFASSVSVYGASTHEVDVDNDLNPRTFYGISKMRGEDHVRRLMKKIPTYILRCGNVYGHNSGIRFDSAINKLMFDAHFKNRISINGDGKQHRSFIHADKLARVFERILDDQLSPGLYDAVEHVLSINDVADTLRGLYPDLESIHINQHLKLRELKVKPNQIVNALFDDVEYDLKAELQDFKEQFSF